MEKCLKISGNKNERILRNSSIVMLSLFAVLAYMDVIAALVPFVLAAYGVMSVLSVAYIVFYFVVRRNSFSFDIPNVSFLCFAFFTILSMIVKKGSLDRDAVAVFNLLQIFSVCLTVFVLKDDVDRILEYFCYLVIVFSLFILLNSLSVFTEYRSQGITPNANALGGLMSISVMCSIYLIFACKNKFVKGLAIVNILISIAALYKTYSRGAQMSLLIGVFVFLFFYVLLKCSPRVRNIVLVVLVLSVVVILLFSSSYFFNIRYGGKSILTGRDQIWKTSLDALNGNWFLGFGGNTEMMYKAYEATGDSYALDYVNCHLLHNIYIQVLVEYGIIVFAAFVAMIAFLVIRESLKCIFSKEKRTINIALPWALGTLLLYMSHGFVESCILYIGGPEQFTFILVISLLYLDYTKEKV